jgi:hypothetical protein
MNAASYLRARSIADPTPADYVRVILFFIVIGGICVAAFAGAR